MLPDLLVDVRDIRTVLFNALVGGVDAEHVGRIGTYPVLHSLVLLFIQLQTFEVGPLLLEEFTAKVIGNALTLFHVDDFLHHLIQQVSSPLNHYPVKLATLQLLGPNLDAIIPDANNNDYILDAHLLQQIEKLLASAVGSIVIETLGDNISLRYLVQLGNSISKDPVPGT